MEPINKFTELKFIEVFPKDINCNFLFIRIPVYNLCIKLSNGILNIKLKEEIIITWPKYPSTLQVARNLDISTI
jgi:hypothetical protein